MREETFTDKKEALAFRNKLKKEGFKTKWKRYDFSDLARCVAYTVTGTKERG